MSTNPTSCPPDGEGAREKASVWPDQAGAGPCTAFMELAALAQPAADTLETPDLEAAPLAPRVMAHLAAALAHDEAQASRGWLHFERHWAEGCLLHRHLAHAYQAAGLRANAAIRDEADGRWHTVAAPLDLALPPATQIVFDLARIYEGMETHNRLTPQPRRLNRRASLVVLASVTAVLGAADIAPALMTLLKDEGWADRTLWTRERMPQSLGRLIEFLASRGFRRLLGRQVGARRAARAYATMMVRLVPGVGRHLLVADVLWLVFEQWKVAEALPDGTRLGQLRPAHERASSRLPAGPAPRAAYNPPWSTLTPRTACASPAPLGGALLCAIGTP
jgi:hypothetical protein